MKSFFGKNILYIDIIKIIACFLVIVNHTQSFMFNHNGDYIALFYSLFFSVCKIAVPLFIIASGALLLDKNYNFKKVFKLIFRISIPLIILSILIYIKMVDFNNINILEFIKIFIENPLLNSLWYLYMLIGLYLVTPFIQKMVKEFKNRDYIIFIIIFLIIPSFISLVRMYFPFNISSYFTYAFIPGILGFYVAGSFLAKLKPNKEGLIYSIIIFIVSYFGMFCSIYIPYKNTFVISYALDSFISFPVVLMGLSFSYIIKYIFNKKVSPRFINELAKETFGIYLIHIIINYEIYHLFFIPILNQNVYIGIVLLEITTFLVSGGIIWLLRRIPIIKKIL